MWWTISSASRGSPRFLVVSVFLLVTHLCKQWKAEHVTMKAISWLLLCPLKMVVFLHPFSKLRLVLEWAWEGERPSNPNMTGQVQSHSCACKPVPCKSLLPSSNIFFHELTEDWRRSWIHHGASRATKGWERPVVLPGGGGLYVSRQEMLDVVGFRAPHPFSASCTEVWGSPRGWGFMPAHTTAAMAGCAIPCWKK